MPIFTDHAYLCSICGHSVSRALGKTCPGCRNKTLVYFSDNRSTEFMKKSREFRKEPEPVSPIFANILMTVIIMGFLGLGSLGIRCYTDWAKNHETATTASPSGRAAGGGKPSAVAAGFTVTH